jgi:26S proteasome regulatory subunit N10
MVTMDEIAKKKSIDFESSSLSLSSLSIYLSIYLPNPYNIASPLLNQSINQSSLTPSIMPLESCMILLDSSQYMRNGDYIPTRLEAQQDAANLLVGTKTQSHPESTVGVSAGTNVLCSPTEDVGKILSALHSLSFASGGGTFGNNVSSTAGTDVTAAVQVASLALKHRRNKNGAQRIVLFVGSPVMAESRALQKAGRQLKKNNVAIDVVCLGELEHNEAKLKELVDAANGRSDDGGERTCHLVTIPPGVLPSDVLASSPIIGAGGAFAASAAAAAMGSMAGGGGAGGGGGGGDGGFAEFGGVDPNMDPELAMALRISMEEERARQERAAASAAAAATVPAAAGDTDMPDASGGGKSATAAAAASAEEMGLSEEEALLQQALAMSMNENEPSTESDAKPSAAPAGMMDVDEEDDDAAMQMALQMSMQPEESSSAEGGGGGGEGGGFQDAAFVNQLLGSAEGVDPNDPEIQEALRKAKEEKDKKDAEEKK